MPPKTPVKKDYIKIEPKEVDFGEICEGIAKIRNLPELSEKNNIWVFHEGPIKLDYVDLYKLKDFVREICPKNGNKSKTAIVVNSGIQSAMALLFSQIAENLLFEIKVFFNLQDAIDWITNK
jgi:hypothetical protein